MLHRECALEVPVLCEFVQKEEHRLQRRTRFQAPCVPGGRPFLLGGGSDGTSAPRPLAAVYTLYFSWSSRHPEDEIRPREVRLLRITQQVSNWAGIPAAGLPVMSRRLCSERRFAPGPVTPPAPSLRALFTACLFTVVSSGVS